MARTQAPDSPIVDPIDALVPPQRRTTRLAIGLIALLLVGWASWLYGLGAIVPRPGCCGSADTGPIMLLDVTRGEVVVRTMFSNSSGHDIRIESASADLPGASVHSIWFAPASHEPLYPADAAPAPIVVPSQSVAAVIVAFTPDQCAIEGGVGERGWGEVTLDIDVADNGWLPSFGRRYTLPHPVVGAGGANLGVLEPAGVPPYDDMDPLAAACAMLSRA